jgi:hypothetical protein
MGTCQVGDYYVNSYVKKAFLPQKHPRHNSTMFVQREKTEVNVFKYLSSFDVSAINGPLGASVT